MADDLVTQSATLATIPTASTIATDQGVGGEHYQQIKLVDGTADSTTVIVAGGCVEASALRVTVASDSTGVLSVDDNGGSLTVDGTFFQATQPVSGTFFQATQPVSVAAVVPVNDNGGSLTVDGTFFQATQPISGSVSVSGNVEIVNDVGNPIPVSGTITQQPAATGGLTMMSPLVSAATTNATVVKASAGKVYVIQAFNTNAEERYLKFHNTASTPTAGSGVVWSVLIPGSTTGAGVVTSMENGLEFSAGIGITLVTGIANTDATAVAASEIVVNIGYK